MRKVSVLRCGVLVSVVSALVVLLGQRVAAVPVPDLIASSDVVVIGTDMAHVKTGTTVSFFINVERVLKGDVWPGIWLPVQWDSRTEAPIWRDSQKASKGVWFLENSSGVWKCIPARSGSVPTLERLFYPVAVEPLPVDLRYDSSLSVIDQIIIEIAVAEKDRANVMPVIDEAAAGYDSAEVRNAFRYLASHATPRSRALGLAGLVQRGDVEGLLLFEAVQASLAVSPELATVVRDIDIAFRNPDPAAIQALGRLSASASRVQAYNSLLPKLWRRSTRERQSLILQPSSMTPIRRFRGRPQSV